jgi:hypothetical protein
VTHGSRCLLALLLAGLFAAAPAAAVADPTWAPAVDISPASETLTADVMSMQVAFDGQGDALAVWAGQDPAHRYRVHTSELPAGSAVWSAPAILSVGGQDGETPRVGVDSQGDALAVWVLYDGISNGIVQASWRPAGTGVWGAPVNLSPAGRIYYEPSIAVNAQGDAIVAWMGSDGTSSIIQAAARPAATGVWGPTTNVSLPGGTSYEPQVKMDRQGNSIATWQRDGIVQAAYRPAASGLWQMPVNLSTADATELFTEVAFDSQGNAMAVWSAGANSQYYVVQASRRSALTGLWEMPANLSASNVPTGDLNSDAPDVAFDGQGDAIVAWAHDEDSQHYIQAAVRRATGGGWSPPVNISLPDRTGMYPQSASEPRVAADAQGDAMVIWKQGQYDQWHAIQTALLPAGSSTWQAPITHSALSEYAESPQLAFDGQGNAIAVWQRSAVPGDNCTCWVAVADSYDVVPRKQPAPPQFAQPVSPSPVQVTPVPPRIVAARLMRSRFHAATKRLTSAKAAVGTVIQVTLSADARLEIAIERRLPGLRKGRGCATPTPALRARHAVACTRLVHLGTIRRALARRGTTAIAFDGHLGGRVLPPGAYLAGLTPVDDGGRGKSKALAFRVLV